jgi:hypothetical protein
MTFLLLKHSGGGSFFDYHGGSLFDCQKHWFPDKLDSLVKEAIGIAEE